MGGSECIHTFSLHVISGVPIFSPFYEPTEVGARIHF